jgi:hypothetical protein
MTTSSRSLSALDAGVEAVAQLIGIGAGELAAKKGGHVVGFDGVHGRAHHAGHNRRDPPCLALGQHQP